MDYNQLLNQLLEGCDMRSELDRRRTYRKCMEYAEANMDAQQLDAFLRLAAERLSQQNMYREYTSDLVKSDGNEKLHIRFEESEGIQLIGNPSGLLYLSRILKNLSMTQEAGEYVYFYYGEPPLSEGSLPLAVYRENDEYFVDIEPDADAENFAAQDETAGEPAYKREVDPADVAGFFLIAQPPAEFGMQPMRVYPVEGWEEIPFDKQTVSQEIGREIDHMVVFSFHKTPNDEARIALDMDDPGVGFITKNDLKLLTGKE